MKRTRNNGQKVALLSATIISLFIIKNTAFADNLDEETKNSEPAVTETNITPSNDTPTSESESSTSGTTNSNGSTPSEKDNTTENTNTSESNTTNTSNSGDQVTKPSTSNQSNKDKKPSTTAKRKTSTTTTAKKVATPQKKVVVTSNTYSSQAVSTSPSSQYTSDSSVSTSDPSIYKGETVKKISAAKPIEKIDDKNTETFIKSIAPRVQILAGKNNLYASVILAQAILESGSGKSNMTQDYHNIFNITGSYLGKSVSFQTLEYANNKPFWTKQSFRIYNSFDESLDDYINLMIKGTTWNSKIYAGSWKSQADTYDKAAKSLQGIYATDPEYAVKLIELIKEYKLDQYDNVDSKTQVVGENIPASPVLSSKLDDSKYPVYNGVEYPGAESYAFGNCTQYVYNRIFQLGGYVGVAMGNGGEWGIKGQAQGYFTTKVPTEGYAVSFPPGVAGSSPIYGHVAFVEKVYSDNSILVSEMNVKGNNIVSERHISAGVAALATYVQPK